MDLRVRCFASTMDIHCYSDVWATTNRCGNDSWTVVCCSNLTYLEPFYYNFSATDDVDGVATQLGRVRLVRSGKNTFS